MKKELMSFVFSLILITVLSSSNAVSYAETDDKDNDLEDKLETFCSMTDEQKAELFDEYSKLAQYEELLSGYCSLDENERENLIEQFVKEYYPKYSEENDWDVEDYLDRYCLMSVEEKEQFVNDYPKFSDHQDDLEKYCSLDESQREEYLAEHEYRIENSKNTRKQLDSFCEMSSEEKTRHLEKFGKNDDHLPDMEVYCSLDDAGKDAFISEHKDTMKETISEHKYQILRASKLTEEQKQDIQSMRSDLRELKISLRDKSISDSDKETMREQFLEKTKEFSLTWLSPRHQIAAGIGSEDIECREGFELVLKTSNASPLCVKESSVDKLVKRGIAISTI